MTIRRKTAVLMTAAALATTGAAVATPATASPVVAGGLVAVNVSDVDVLNDSLNRNEVLSRNNVGIGVAAGVAATVCGVTAQVGVIASQVARTGGFTCESSAGDQVVEIVGKQ